MAADISLLKEGISYLKRVAKINPAKSPLTNDTIYNMVCLGLETSLTALLLDYGEMVDHGSASSLMRTLGKHKEIPDTWIGEGRFLNKFNTYCSLDVMPAKIPTDEEAKRMIVFGKEILAFVEKETEAVLHAERTPTT